MSADMVHQAYEAAAKPEDGQQDTVDQQSEADGQQGDELDAADVPDHKTQEALGKGLEQGDGADTKASRKDRQHAIDALLVLRLEELPALGPFDPESISPRLPQAIESNIEDMVCMQDKREVPVIFEEILQAASLSFRLVPGLEPGLALTSTLEILAALFTQNNQKLHEFHSAARKSAVNPVARWKDTTGSDLDVETAMAANQARLSKWEGQNVEFTIRRMLGLIEMVQLYQDFFSKYKKDDLKESGKEARKKMGLRLIRHEDVTAIISMTFAKIYHEQRLHKTVDTLYKEFSEKFRADLNRGRVLGEIQNHLGTGALVMLSTTKRWVTNTAKARPDTTGVVLKHLLLRWPRLRMHDYLYSQLWEPYSLGRSLTLGLLGYECSSFSFTTYDSLQPCEEEASGESEIEDFDDMDIELWS